MRKKIAQLFICKNPDSKEEIKHFIKLGIGGFMIGKGGEIVTHEQADLEGDDKSSLKNFTSYLIKTAKELNELPLFLAIDGEGGEYFNRLKTLSDYKNQRYYGVKYEGDHNLKYFEEQVSEFAKLMNDLNLNMNFAPLVDCSRKGYRGYVAEEKIKIIKGDDDLTTSEVCSSHRSYSDKMSTVITLGLTAMKVFQDRNIIPTLKHFPTYGILNVDENPHVVFSDSDISKKDLLEELKPYEVAFSKGAYAIMKGQNSTCLDKGVPATLSKKVDSFLRKTMKFDGLSVADELNMFAIRIYLGADYVRKVAVQAVMVNDILLISHSDTFEIMLDAIVQESKSNPEMVKKIEESYDKIIEYKKKIGLI